MAVVRLTLPVLSRYLHEEHTSWVSRAPHWLTRLLVCIPYPPTLLCLHNNLTCSVKLMRKLALTLALARNGSQLRDGAAGNHSRPLTVSTLFSPMTKKKRSLETGVNDIRRLSVRFWISCCPHELQNRSTSMRKGDIERSDVWLGLISRDGTLVLQKLIEKACARALRH
jgi:hypothetical protein